MKISNPPIPENINSNERTDQHPVLEVLKYLAIISGALLLLIGVFALLARVLSPYIPFSWEQRLAETNIAVTESYGNERAKKRAQSIQDLSQKLYAVMDFPADITIRVHYSELTIPNAYASIGGEIYIFEGLYGRLQSENELSMLLAHEMAHVRHRDVIRALVQNSSTAILLSLFGLNSTLVSIVTEIGNLRYSRQQEAAADAAGLEAVYRLYGHVNGASDLFVRLEQVYELDDMGRASNALPEILSSHPDLKHRIAMIESLADANAWPKTGDLLPLNPTFD